MEPTQPHIQWLMGAFHVGKGLGCEGGHLPASRAKVENE